jgi:NAD(P)-dependent dehydrogenase (short-subunit alcohol dehydrogenase family)
MRDFSGRVAVVTGAASGIGAALAERFAAEGMKVVLADVERAALAPTAERLERAGATVLAVPTDVAKSDDVRALADQAWEAFGGVDVLCNNAGVFVGGKLWERSLNDWQWLVGVNLFGVIHGIHHFVPRMLAQDRPGHVVNTASLAGLISSPFLGVYGATKHAIVNISETLHHELQLVGAKLRVSILCPGMVNTRAPEVERNRPAELRNDGSRRPEEQALDEAVRAGLAAGMAPAEVAGIVVDALREDRFYIYTDLRSHPAIRMRMEDVIAGRSPTLAPTV